MMLPPYKPMKLSKEWLTDNTGSKDLYWMQWFCSRYGLKNFEITTEKFIDKIDAGYTSLAYVTAKPIHTAHPEIELSKLVSMIQTLYLHDTRSMNAATREAYDEFYTLRMLSE